MGRSSSSPTRRESLEPMCSIFRRFLKRQGLKFTSERAKILDAVLSHDNVFEADELLFEMRATGHRVSKATIYRTFKHLLESKIITEVLLDSKQSHYQLSIGREPKAHLVCVETQQIIEFPAPELTRLRDRICRKHGFVPLGHRFVVYGTSPEAQQDQEQPGDEQL